MTTTHNVNFALYSFALVVVFMRSVAIFEGGKPFGAGGTAERSVVLAFVRWRLMKTNFSCSNGCHNYEISYWKLTILFSPFDPIVLDEIWLM